MEHNISFLESLKNKIEKMSKTEHIEILKIIKKNPNIKLNENKSGVYINLTFLPQLELDEITQYISYVQQQQTMLDPMEKEKMDFKNTYFIEKENKEDVTSIYSYVS
jgi:hypothetical protein